ncbi:MAG: DUF4476 domain-containing protein [Bacteroidales bacterium]
MKKSALFSDSKATRSGAAADKMLGLLSLLNLLLAFVLLMLLSHNASAYGHPAASELHMRMHDNSYFSFRIGHMENSPISDAHLISNLTPGRHYLEVVRYQVYYSGRRMHFRNPQLVFQGYINISGRSAIFAMIDHRGRYRVESRENLHAHHGHNGYQQPVYAPVLHVMSHQSFAMLMNTLANTSFDSSRLNIAQQALSDNYVTSEQVFQLMGMFTFESNKLKLAQFAYARTVDKHNYFIVHNAFTFSSSSNSLNAYIARNF